MIRSQLALAVTGLIFFFNSNAVFADDAYIHTKPEMTPERLERQVIRQFKYINARLHEHSATAHNIEESGNNEAIALFHQAREDMDKIAEQINHKQYTDAIPAIKKINVSIKNIMKMIRAKKLAIRSLKNDMESAQIANDAYIERANKWKLGQGNGGEKAHALTKEAVETRTHAEQNLKQAIENFNKSTELLKKAVVAARKWRSTNNMVEEVN